MIQQNLAFAKKGNGSLHTPTWKESASMKLKDIKMIFEIILDGFKILSLLKEAFKNKNKKLTKSNKKNRCASSKSKQR